MKNGIHHLPRILIKVVKLFFKLGMIAFGGPPSPITMLRDESVKRRKWPWDQEFLDLMGATNIIPKPNSTEMAIHIGSYEPGG
jgi:chromate transporter